MKTLFDAVNEPNDIRWEELDTIPFEVSSNFLLKLNEQEFILPADKEEWNGLYKYYVHLDKFEKYFEYPENKKVREYSLKFSAKQNRLYGTGFYQPMFIIDINNGKFIEWKEIKSRTNTLKLEHSICGQIVNANDEIHLIVGCDTDKHLVWEEGSRKFSQIYDFKKLLFVHSELQMIHVQTTQEIIMIGGYDNQHNTIIWGYKIPDRKWQKIAKIYSDIQSTALTSDEQYIIMSEGRLIYALQINSKQLYKSSLNGPWWAKHVMTITGGLKNEILVIGWIKSLFKSTQFQSMEQPPMYLMKLIGAWYSQEEIHWITKESGRHFIIKIKHILLSLYQYMEK